MAWTFESLRKKHPALSDADIGQAVEYLNQPPRSRHEIWDGENQVSGVEVATGPDGLTRPQRELNRFAEENALPIPFRRSSSK
jgi:hypothetical protein